MKTTAIYPQTLYLTPDDWGGNYYTDDIDAEVEALNTQLGWSVAASEATEYELIKIISGHGLYKMCYVRNDVYALIKYKNDMGYSEIGAFHHPPKGFQGNMAPMSEQQALTLAEDWLSSGCKYGIVSSQ